MNVRNMLYWSDCLSKTSKGFQCCSLMVSKQGNPALLRRAYIQKNLIQRHLVRDKKMLRRAN